MLRTVSGWRYTLIAALIFGWGLTSPLFASEDGAQHGMLSSFEVPLPEHTADGDALFSPDLYDLIDMHPFLNMSILLEAVTELMMDAPSELEEQLAVVAAAKAAMEAAEAEAEAALLLTDLPEIPLNEILLDESGSEHTGSEDGTVSPAVENLLYEDAETRRVEVPVVLVWGTGNAAGCTGTGGGVRIEEYNLNTGQWTVVDRWLLPKSLNMSGEVVVDGATYVCENNRLRLAEEVNLHDTQTFSETLELSVCSDFGCLTV